MMTQFVARSFGTHDGNFHADEVTACALLLLFDLIDREYIRRTRCSEVLDMCEYVCDVGEIYNPAQKRFDHHQAVYQGTLSSAGMVLKYLQDQQVISPSLYRYFNTSLIIGIDAIDNGRTTPFFGHCTFSGVVANFVPIQEQATDEKLNNAFMKAVEFVYGHLKRLQEKFNYIAASRSKIEKEMRKNQKILVFDESIPWMESFFDLGGKQHPALFIVMPVGNQWKVRGIPPSSKKRMQVRLMFPSSWSGLSHEELQKETGLSGAVFCHKGRFISIWETKEEALVACNYVLKEEGA